MLPPQLILVLSAFLVLRDSVAQWSKKLVCFLEIHLTFYKDLIWVLHIYTRIHIHTYIYMFKLGSLMSNIF